MFFPKLRLEIMIPVFWIMKTPNEANSLRVSLINNAVDVTWLPNQTQYICFAKYSSFGNVSSTHSCLMKIDFSSSLVPKLFILSAFTLHFLSYVTISERHSAFVAFVRPWNLKWSRNCDKISLLWLLHLLIPCTLGRTFITIILMEISCSMACLSVVTAWLASSLFVAELS